MVAPALTYLEFFAGGGMARAGFGAGWRCLFANDIDARKGASYVANWGVDHFRLADIHKLDADDIPGTADVAWASFPCQDLSLAGAGRGLDGARSGAFWGLRDLLVDLAKRGRAPRIIVLENVVGALTSTGGADFTTLCQALHDMNYDFGAMVIDATYFTPQSRPRLFIVAVARGATIANALAGDRPDPLWTTNALARARERLPLELRQRWRWWRLPSPPARNVALADMIGEGSADVSWHPVATTERLLSLMAPIHLAAVRAIQRTGEPRIGTIYRRTRVENGVKVQRAEARFDGVAGCLRTPGGGSSRQFIIAIHGDIIRTRLLSGREAARLMGLPDDYRLPARDSEAYHLLGDGVAVPVVRWLARHLLEPLARGAASEAMRAIS